MLASQNIFKIISYYVLYLLCEGMHVPSHGHCTDVMTGAQILSRLLVLKLKHMKYNGRILSHATFA